MDEDFYLKADDFFRKCFPSGLTFDDISLATRYSEVLPREVRLETSLSESIKLSVPSTPSNESEIGFSIKTPFTNAALAASDNQ